MSGPETTTVERKVKREDGVERWTLYGEVRHHMTTRAFGRQFELLEKAAKSLGVGDPPKREVERLLYVIQEWRTACQKLNKADETYRKILDEGDDAMIVFMTQYPRRVVGALNAATEDYEACMALKVTTFKAFFVLARAWLRQSTKDWENGEES